MSSILLSTKDSAKPMQTPSLPSKTHSASEEAAIIEWAKENQTVFELWILGDHV